ncbi:MAG: hypothetical protein E7258_02035 [Lachnospiraceae bacterium]|nr:hypothetical protein [Lachnospiraceae bacterium]
MIFRFVSHDLNEGIIRYRKRYLLIILVAIISCFMLDRSTEYITTTYGGYWTPLEYGINLFLGRYPFVYRPDSMDTFTVPFVWILTYILLAFVIGDYVQKDMQGYGMYMMLKSKKRSYWWISKCVWCVIVNLVYFGLIWLTYISYAWMKNGDIAIYKNLFIRSNYFGWRFEDKSVGFLIMMVVVMPILVGVVQSIIQIFLSVVFDATVTMVFVAGGLVLSCYYGNPLIPHGYGMLLRYYKDESNPDFVPNDIQSGIVILLTMIVIATVVGYVFFRRKNILSRR